MQEEKGLWVTPSRGDFTFDEMVESIRGYITNNPNTKYELIVGTDSQTFYASNTTRYVVAIILRKVGKGALYYVRKEYKEAAKSLRQKIWNEVTMNYATIKSLENGLQDLNVKIIPHVDVGDKGDTRALIKEVTGLFLGEGYEVQIKPYSFASSSVADKHSK